MKFGWSWLLNREIILVILQNVYVKYLPVMNIINKFQTMVKRYFHWSTFICNFDSVQLSLPREWRAFHEIVDVNELAALWGENCE